MKLISTIEELKDTLSAIRTTNVSLGLVPTMGALHEGHLSLVNKSVEMCDLTVVTIFVNPTQFNNAIDLEKYPKTLSKDLELLSSSGCDILFTPSSEEMYPDQTRLPQLELGDIEYVLEGEHRPGHFQGVGIIVNKFFDIVQPDYAFFGQKDLQQYFIIKNIIHFKKLPINLIQVPIMRENSGLAMSSRNSRLKVSERLNAGIIFNSLQKAKAALINGTPIEQVKESVINLFNEQNGMNLEYFELVETVHFSNVKTLDYEELALCIAVNIGEVRLIDNLLLFS